MRFEDLAEFDTKLTADVVAWRPNSSSLACATYYLNKEDKTRQGCIYLLDFDHQKTALSELGSVFFANSGILDLKWIDDSRLITIDSENCIKLFKVYDKNNLELVVKQEIEREESIGLTLDFLLKENGSFQVLTSDTKGFLTLSEFDQNRVESIESFKAHDFEVWSVLIDSNESGLIYSGADDCLLKMWDLRVSKEKCTQMCKVFEGGVCSIIQPKHDNSKKWLEGYNENHILSSSYDEHIYVLDKRNLKTPLKRSDSLNGGVWKMKIHPSRNLILCACMHIGVHLVNAESLTSELYYDQHGLNNLAYGCDWANFQTETIATCSFYNHQLKIWKLID